MNFTKTYVGIFKTGRKCLKIRVTLTGEALETGYRMVQGLYNRLKRPFNKRPTYKHERTEFGDPLVYIWWDTPNTVYPDKENSKGGDKSHWKLGWRELNGGMLDTYNSTRQYRPVYNRRNKWSYFKKCLLSS